MPSAVVTGATGILGREIVQELSRDPQRWPTVWALSRSKKEAYSENVKHTHLDLQDSAEEMAKQIGHIKPDYIFFTAYLAKDDEGEATKVNGDMLQNFLDALKITGASKGVKRIILTTGAKQYGVHLGTPKNPMEESDRWLSDSDRPPNFYYRQQEILKKASKEQGWDWVVTYPNDVIGVAKGNFMNLVNTLGLYAAVTKAMGKELEWPGSPAFYCMFDDFTSSKLHAQFNAWAATTDSPQVSNQAFNVVNGDTESWQNMWPKVAAKFGLKVPEQMFTEKDYNLEFGPDGMLMPLMENPPLSEFAAERGLKNDPRQLVQSKVEGKIDLSKWSQKPEVKEAWQKLAKEHNLEEDAFEKATWGFLNFVFGRNFNLVISMSKARKAGWTGYEDTWTGISESLDGLVKEKVLPPF